MKLIPASIICILLFILNANAQYNSKHFAKLYSLTGTWKAEKRNGTVYENWVRQNDSTLTAVSYRVKDADTVQLETVMLSLRSGVILYTPTTANQNDQLPVEFKLVNIQGGRFDFENKLHDFPQLISYEFRNNDSLFASISRPTPNGNRTIPFNYERVK